MAILQGDIKLLKSAVMADTSDGGGAMTGIAVIDGQSNNLFPDTSAMDRAIGRVQQRLVYGVAHVDNTDTLMGAHAIITEVPADPLVHCVLMQSGAWAEERSGATDRIEKYLVKGPRMGPVIYDTHYAGSLQLRLITFVNATFPSGGDGVVLRNPNGNEQYLRVLKIATTTQVIAVEEEGRVLTLTATVGVCDLGQELLFDFYGPPAARIFTAANFAQVFSTSPATGAKFFGMKSLTAIGAPGDLSALVSGIYTPLVPAATIETPIIDQYPLLELPGISTAAVAAVTLTNGRSHAWGPGSEVTMPTLIAPGTFGMSYNGTNFTDSGGGSLLQGTSPVGVIEYRTGKVTLFSASPSYGTGATGTFTYKPASPSGAACHSDLLYITSANQGLSFTNVLEPIPAKGTFSLSYMAQGRWYTLADGLNGKIEGSTPAYGVGTLSYATGSIAFTLGAIPDIGSPVIFQWGNKQASQPITAAMPRTAVVDVQLPARAYPGSVVFNWVRNTVAKSASVNAAGTISGDGTGTLVGNALYRLSPTLFPDGNLQITYSEYASGATGKSGFSGINFNLTSTPVAPGSVTFALTTAYPADCSPYGSANQQFRDDGAGNIITCGNWSRLPNVVVGTINYTTGAVVFTSTTVSQYVLHTYQRSRRVWFHTDRWVEYAQELQPATLQAAFDGAVSYAGGATSAATLVVVPDYYVQVPTSAATRLATTGLTFTLGGELYTSYGGVLRRGWTASTGTAVAASAGAVSDSGRVSFLSFPITGSNEITWYNAAIDQTGPGVASGAFRTASAPLKAGNFQLSSGAMTSDADGGGVLTGSFDGLVDATRGYVRWSVATTIAPSSLRYNAVFLQYLPLEKELLGLDTARLPLDGRVPIFRKGDKVLVHNTQTFVLPNPLAKNVPYNWGRVRTASVRVKDLLGVTVPSTLYTTDLDVGTITVPTASNITAYSQPLTVEHRIEDLVVCSVADISGKLSFTRSLTHDFPLGTSFASSALVFGDLFSRAHNVVEQLTWTSLWSDTRIGNAPLAQFNAALYPLVVTNRGAITERWALIFTSSTAFRIIGESVGEIGTGNTSTDAAPGNPATLVPYFTLPALGWGNGWAPGNVLRFNTDACGKGFWAVRTVLQGPPSVASDKFALAFRGDVDRP